ncbi:MAG: glycosyltransferase family 2 protein, partial [Pyrinomonadaceae bacterium]
MKQRRAEDQVLTSIIIPVFNKVDFTFHCLQTLLNEIDMSTTEVIVVNNASTDETQKMLAYFERVIRVFDNEENQGFVDACNQGATLARGTYFLFLNNDTAVQSGWLDNLLDTIQGDPSVGAVGSMFLYPDGRIQEAGAIVWKTGEAYHYGWGKSPDDRRYNFAREVDYCSAASLLIRKDLFERLGGFDRRYAPAYYEDVDLCFGVRSLGYKVVYQPLSRVIHYEGVTAGRNPAVGTKHYQIINQEKFYQKWRDVLERSHFEKDCSLDERASNRTPGPRFLVLDDRVPMPDSDAGSGRMFHILRLLTNLGRPVFVSLRPLPEYEQMLWKQGIETAKVGDYHHLLKTRGFRVAILSRPEVASALLKPIRRADRQIKITFDMVDAYFIRLGRQHTITGDRNLA